MKSLTLTEAAALRKLSPWALRAKVKAGTVPGPKVGKRGGSFDVHLAEWIHEPYAVRRQALQGERKEYRFRSTNAKTRGRFGARSADGPLRLGNGPAPAKRPLDGVAPD